MKEGILSTSYEPLMRERGFSVITNPELVGAKRRGLLIEAHPDDSAMAEGALELLTSRGVEMTVATLTDGGARTIRGIRSDQVVPRRQIEGVRGAVTSRAARLVHAALPFDSLLQEHEEEGIAVVQGLVAVHDPEFVIVTNTKDPHGDHASAGRITREVVNYGIPWYEMDTITFTDMQGERIPLTHALYVPGHIKQQRDRSYRSHTSQTSDLPQHEAVEVEKVIQMPTQRGREYDVYHAAVLHHGNSGDSDPISELLEPYLLFSSAENVA